MARIACEECGKSISDRAVSCPQCGLPLASAAPPPLPPDTPSMQPEQVRSLLSNRDAIACPKCGSWQVHAEKRGWNIWTGNLLSSLIIVTCLRCAHRFKPGEGGERRQGNSPNWDGNPWAWLVLFGVLGFLVLVAGKQ
jgi:DNA-directed RNA polymerase subunit RPC12/RpoP